MYIPIDLSDPLTLSVLFAGGLVVAISILNFIVSVITLFTR